MLGIQCIPVFEKAVYTETRCLELEAGDACGDEMWTALLLFFPLSCPYGQPCWKEDMRLLLHSYFLLIDCKYLCQMFNLTIYWPSSPSDELLSGNQSSPSAKKLFSTPTELKIGCLTHSKNMCVLICMLFARSVSEQGVL